jgi:hypothetical protein
MDVQEILARQRVAILAGLRDRSMTWACKFEGAIVQQPMPSAAA